MKSKNNKNVKTGKNAKAAVKIQLDEMIKYLFRLSKTGQTHERKKMGFKCCNIAGFVKKG